MVALWVASTAGADNDLFTLELNNFDCIIIIYFLLILHADLSWITPREGSIAGGTTVQVYGSGFTTDQYTGQNVLYLGDIPCIVQG